MATDTHLAAVLHGAHDMRMETCQTTPPGPDEVQVRIRATGLCGSDMHYYHSAKNGVFTVRQPLVLGHEAAGEVTAVGKSVRCAGRVVLLRAGQYSATA